MGGYACVTQAFNRGVLPGVSRAIKAVMQDASVIVEYEI